MTQTLVDFIFLPRVVCVGGDGMFSEILHGLVARTQNDHGVDQNQPDAELVPCSLRIGIIPAGELWESCHYEKCMGNLLYMYCTDRVASVSSVSYFSQNKYLK